MPEEGKKAKTMSKEVMERLSKPVVHKKPKDVYKDCSFQPKLCEKSLELTATRANFHTRIGEVIENHRKQRDARQKAKPPHSFSPKLNISAEYEAKLAGRGDLYKRLADDIEARKTKAKAMEANATAGFTFMPEVTKSPKGVKVEGSFLERVASDIEARKTRVEPTVSDPQCTGVPEISKASKKMLKGGPKFMSRMTDDLDKRRDKEAEIRKELAKAPKYAKAKK